MAVLWTSTRANGGGSRRMIAIVLFMAICSALLGICLPMNILGSVPGGSHDEGFNMALGIPDPPVQLLHDRDAEGSGWSINHGIVGASSEFSETGDELQMESHESTRSLHGPSTATKRYPIRHASGEQEPADSHGKSFGAAGAGRTHSRRRMHSVPAAGQIVSGGEAGGPNRIFRTSKKKVCSLSPGMCKPGETCCGSACVVTTVDPNHCGRCGHICKWDRACCNGKCRRLSTDERNCGKCGTVCAVGTQCLFGLCGY